MEEEHDLEYDTATSGPARGHRGYSRGTTKGPSWEADPLRGLFAACRKLAASLKREVLPHAALAWYRPESAKIGYEVSFTRYFYKSQPMRTIKEIRRDILALEEEIEGLLGETIGEVPK